jgi:hypothetical protein
MATIQPTYRIETHFRNITKSTACSSRRQPIHQPKKSIIVNLDLNQRIPVEFRRASLLLLYTAAAVAKSLERSDDLF